MYYTVQQILTLCMALSGFYTVYFFSLAQEEIEIF